MEKAKRSPLRTALKIIGGVTGLVILSAAVAFCVLLACEYKPADTESVEIVGQPSKTLSAGDTFTILTWNIGYGALGDNADFFMDGGTMVYTADEARVQKNVSAIIGFITDSAPDVVFLQETDRSSDRTYRADETALISGSFPGYSAAFANNFKTLFVPYPIPPIGKTDSGLLTMNSYTAVSAQRIQLPIPFKWPVSAFNLKRCLLVERVPVDNSDSELVLINLHLEAYDDGEGKIAQAKMLKELMDRELDKGNYVIVGGDFNQVFSNIDTSAYPLRSDKWKPEIIDAEEFIERGWQLVTDSSVPTCRSLDNVYAGADKSEFQFYVIDGFIVSPNITVESCETVDLDFANSDHNPVTLTVTLSDTQDRS